MWLFLFDIFLDCFNFGGQGCDDGLLLCNPGHNIGFEAVLASFGSGYFCYLFLLLRHFLGTKTYTDSSSVIILELLSKQAIFIDGNTLITDTVIHFS